MNSSNSHNPQSTGNGANDHEETKQREIISCMDPIVYKAAANGKINRFNRYTESELNLLLTPNKNTILHIFISSTKPKSSISFVEQILNKCRSLLNQANSKGETPLHIASRFGLEDVVKMLINCAKTQDDVESGIEAAKEMLRMLSIDKDTVLHEAVRNNHLAIVQIFITEDPDLVYLANDSGENPLYLAAERGYGDIVSEILETCTSPVYNGPFGRTALHAAVINKDPAMARKILEKNQTLTKEVDQQGWTPLHHASHLGPRSMVKLLLNYDKSAAYIRDQDGKMTPLHIAALCGLTHKLIAKTIISQCPDCCEIVDHRGRNALHFAVESYSVLGLRSLLQNPSISNLINQKDDDGNTPLHLLATVGFNGYPLLRHPLADKKAVNKQKLTAVDILDSSNENILPLTSKSFLMKNLIKAGCKRSLRNKIKIKCNPVRAIRGVSSAELFKEAKDSHLIVATLIATVTFAAGFTVPGGYNSDKGNDQGIAVLARKTAFKAFLVSDTWALVFSTSAVFIHFFLAMQGDEKSSMYLLTWAAVLIVLALALMVVAFAIGTYAVTPHNNEGLGTVTCVILGCYFTLSLLFILVVRFLRAIRVL